MSIKRAIATVCAAVLVTAAAPAMAQPTPTAAANEPTVAMSDSERARSPLGGASQAELTYVGLMSGAQMDSVGIKGYGHAAALTPQDEKAWAGILAGLQVQRFDFEHFNSEVRSGNPMRVEAALTEGGQALADHLVAQQNRVAASGAAPQACGPTFCVAGIVLVAVSTVAAGINYAGAVNVAVWAAVWTWTAGPNASPSDKLDYQNAVAEITTDLAGTTR